MMAKRSNYNQPNIYGMIQNVLIASMNKGQAPIICVMLIFIIPVLKLSPADSKLMIDDIVSVFKSFYFIGWPLALFCILGWYLGTKKLRKLHAAEMNRVTEEKGTLQKQLSNRQLRSTKS